MLILMHLGKMNFTDINIETYELTVGHNFYCLFLLRNKLGLNSKSFLGVFIKAYALFTVIHPLNGDKSGAPPGAFR